MVNTVLRNFLSNALKFSKIGGKIVISYLINWNEVIFTVADNGVGIPKEIMGKLFTVDDNISTPGTCQEKAPLLVFRYQPLVNYNSALWKL